LGHADRFPRSDNHGGVFGKKRWFLGNLHFRFLSVITVIEADKNELRRPGHRCFQSHRLKPIDNALSCKSSTVSFAEVFYYIAGNRQSLITVAQETQNISWKDGSCSFTSAWNSCSLL